MSQDSLPEIDAVSEFDAVMGIFFGVKFAIAGAFLGFLIPFLFGIFFVPDLGGVPDALANNTSLWDSANKIWIFALAGLGAAIGLFIGGFGEAD